ncbi:MAG: cobalt-precorrin-5B (C(1))-methyltransferase [Rhodobacteraceae bacterium]|nr:cobalt-precorrin-5B (C(1))-methyltransferase [Paracoccaceae bacterium]
MDQGAPPAKLRTGFTTGACATAAAAAAGGALLTGRWTDPVRIRLPRGAEVSFALAAFRSGEGWAEAAVVKDAGDDPDVTHGATIVARVERGAPGSGVTFRAGPGVGIVTRPGLPIPPGEPAINPVPRRMMSEALTALAEACGAAADFEVRVSIPGGEALALKTWNPRLGIEGGLSILGTTGIVRPFSCAAWIASIHRGIDVALACGLVHCVGSTGATSEKAAQQYFGLPDHAMLDMGDFAGGMLKYLRRHPIPRVTIAGGFGKLAKLAQGALDLHSSRSQVDLARLARRAGDLIPEQERGTGWNSALQLLEVAGPELAQRIAGDALVTARALLGAAPIDLDAMVVDRGGRILAIADRDGSRGP